MVLPLVLGSAPHEHAGAHHHGVAMAAVTALPADGAIATLLHTAGYLLATGLTAIVVYEKLGLRLLRRMWINLDLLWGLALIATALLTPLV
jgi:hypothetical protein